MKHLRIFALVVFAAIGGLASTVSPLADDKTIQAITNLDEQVNKLVLETDTSELKKLLADDFSYVNSSGQLMDGDRWISDLKSGMQFDSFTAKEVKARLYGDTAVVTARVFANWRRGGDENNRRFRYTRVYVWKTNRWQLAAYQITPTSD